MKKILALIIVLVLLGGAAFVVGYLPLRHESGHFSLLYSKTSGWDGSVITPGEFAWRWELLIPTNSQIHHFPDELREVSVRSTALLPSADVYESLLEGNPSLRQSLHVEVAYRLQPEWIMELAPRGITAERLTDQLAFSDNEIHAATVVFAESAIMRQVENDELSADALSRRIHDGLSSRFPHLQFTAVAVRELSIPDPLLWRLGRSTFEAIQQAREETLVEAARVSARDQSNRDRLVETLQQYGRVLNEFPVLLDYLEVVAATGRDPLNIESLRDAGMLAPP